MAAGEALDVYRKLASAIHFTSTSGFSHLLWNSESVTLAIFLLHLELLLPPIGNLEQQPSLTNKKQGKVKSRFRSVPKQGES
jgi:hypothetical protein